MRHVYPDVQSGHSLTSSLQICTKYTIKLSDNIEHLFNPFDDIVRSET